MPGSYWKLEPFAEYHSLSSTVPETSLSIFQALLLSDKPFTPRLNRAIATWPVSAFQPLIDLLNLANKIFDTLRVWAALNVLFVPSFQKSILCNESGNSEMCRWHDIPGDDFRPKSNNFGVQISPKMMVCVSVIIDTSIAVRSLPRSGNKAESQARTIITYN